MIVTPESIAKDYNLRNLKYACIKTGGLRYEYHLIFSYNGQIYREATVNKRGASTNNEIFCEMLTKLIQFYKIPLVKHKIVQDIIKDL